MVKYFTERKTSRGGGWDLGESVEPSGEEKRSGVAAGGRGKVFRARVPKGNGARAAEGAPLVRPRSAAAAASVQSNAHRSRDGGGRRLPPPPMSSSRRGSSGVQPVVSAWPPVPSDRRRRRCRRRLSAAASRRSRCASCVFSRRGREESLPAPRRVLRAAVAAERGDSRPPRGLDGIFARAPPPPSLVRQLTHARRAFVVVVLRRVRCVRVSPRITAVTVKQLTTTITWPPRLRALRGRRRRPVKVSVFSFVFLSSLDVGFFFFFF